MSQRLSFIFICFIITFYIFLGDTRYSSPEDMRNYDLNEFYVHPTTFISEINDSIIIMPSGDSTTSYDLLKRMGEDFYHLRTPIRRSACSDCHSLKSGGTGIYNKSPGGGEHIGIYKKLFKDWSGIDAIIEEDRKPIKNFSTLNSFRLHRDGVILHSIDSSDFPLEHQVGKAMNAHMVSDIVLECQQDPMYNQISYTITGKPLDEILVKQAISMFEQSLVTSENRMNKYLRGEVRSIKKPAGLKLYMDKNCNSCHMNNVKSISRAINPMRDSVKATCLDCNLKDHKGFFHTSEKISMNSAIRRCDSFLPGKKLNNREIYQIAAFIRNNLHDPRFSK